MSADRGAPALVQRLVDRPAPASASLFGMTQTIGNDDRAEDAIDCSVIVPVLCRRGELHRADRGRDAPIPRLLPGSSMIEFVFADGGSRDRTREILERLAATDPRIRVFDNPRRYASSGLNVALRHSRGRWVVRMDAHTLYPADYINAGSRASSATGLGGSVGHRRRRDTAPYREPFSLALGSKLGRGGSRKWGGRGLAGRQ